MGRFLGSILMGILHPFVVGEGCFHRSYPLVWDLIVKQAIDAEYIYRRGKSIYFPITVIL